VRDLSNTVTKTVKPPVTTNEIFYGGTGCLLLSSPTNVVLYDLQQQKTLSDVTSPPVKYAIWSQDGNMVALLSKHSTHDHLQNVSILLTYLPSCDNRKQEFVPKLFGARDNPHQVGCMGRQRGLRLYDPQSYEVLLAQRV